MRSTRAPHIASGHPARTRDPIVKSDSLVSSKTAAEWLATGRRESIAATPTLTHWWPAPHVPSLTAFQAQFTSCNFPREQVAPTYSVLPTSKWWGRHSVVNSARTSTPRTIADFMVRVLNIKQGMLLDPACGSAGLLAAALRNARSDVRQPDQLDVYGNDLNPRMVQLPASISSYTELTATGSARGRTQL